MFSVAGGAVYPSGPEISLFFARRAGLLAASVTRTVRLFLVEGSLLSEGRTLAGRLLDWLLVYFSRSRALFALPKNARSVRFCYVFQPSQSFQAQ